MRRGAARVARRLAGDASEASGRFLPGAEGPSTAGRVQCSRAPFLRLAFVPCELVRCLHPCCLGGGEVQRTALGHVRAWQGLAT